MKNDPESIALHKKLKHSEMCVTAKIYVYDLEVKKD